MRLLQRVISSRLLAAWRSSTAGAGGTGLDRHLPLRPARSPGDDGPGILSGAANTALSYLAALIVGIVATADLFPLGTVLGDSNLWVAPAGDLAQNLTGHLAYQVGGWHWPLLLAPNLAWPHGTSIAMTDSNPLVSMLAKLLAALRGRPANLLGFWFAACWLLQPVAAVYALRGFGCRSPMAALAAAIFAVSFPALLFRIGHINLCGHFLLLFALGLAARMCGPVPLQSRRWIVAGALLSVAVLCHPYLYVFATAVLAAPALQAVLDRRADARRSVACCAVAVVTPVLLYWLLSGTLGGADRGFGFWSMNLLSPIWPQRSGVFGPDLPIIDGTGGQYEGFNYLGAGGLLLLAVGLVLMVHRIGVTRNLPSRPDESAALAVGTNWRDWRAMGIVLLALTLLALSTKVYIGRTLVLSLGVKPWDQIFGTIQASGRAFWIVGYAVILACTAAIARTLPIGLRGAVLAVAVVLQLVDTAPLRSAAQAYLAGHDQVLPPVRIPPQAKLLSLLPVCMHPGHGAALADTIRLQAVRAGLRLRDMRTSRLPRWFNCESALTDGLELPLMPGEVRILTEASAIARLRPAALGPDRTCRTVQGLVVCARDLPLDQGEPFAAATDLPVATRPIKDLNGATLDPLLSFGWHKDGEGRFWSEGPHATLLFRVMPPSSGPLSLRLKIDGIAGSADGIRVVKLRVGLGPQTSLRLQDRRPGVVDVLVPPESFPNGVMRIAIDIDHPIDPRRRDLSAPVGRAGVRLYSLSLQAPDASVR